MPRCSDQTSFNPTGFADDNDDRDWGMRSGYSLPLGDNQMLARLLGPVRLVAKALAADDSPRQLALGLVIGMLMGLIPKGNLTTCALATLLLSTRVNVGVGLATAAVFSWIGLAIDPFAHKLGWIVLSCRPLQGFFAWFADLPLVAWSGLNNTVVVGQLLIGAYLAYPAYWFAKRLFATIQPWTFALIRRYRITRILFGLDLGTRWGMSE